MGIRQLQDQQLLAETKSLVEKERKVLTVVLQHLREIDRRRLFSDLGYQSLFEYAVKELKYSENQAAHRLNAMRLIKDIPEVEQSIASGELSLSNASMAQRAFRQKAKQQTFPLPKAEKEKVVDTLKNKSAREGQRALLELVPQIIDQRSFEKERQVTPTAVEVRLLMDDALKAQLEEVRALLGPKAVDMGYAELIAEMAKLSVQKLSENKFGKRRAATALKSNPTKGQRISDNVTVTSQQSSVSSVKTTSSQNPRYISKALTHAVWQQAGGRCQHCGSRRNLNVDHVLPVARGGTSTLENLRLLCFSCNQRQAIKVFGLHRQDRFRRHE